MNFFNFAFPDDRNSSEAHKSSPENSSSVSDSRKRLICPGWSFDAIVESLASKSEAVIESCRSDIEEFKNSFRSGLQEFSPAIVRAIPGSLDDTVTMVHGSLQSFGQTIDSVGEKLQKSTAQIISKGKGSILHTGVNLIDLTDLSRGCENPIFSEMQLSSEMREDRFNMQLHALQSDLNTYCVQPEDKAEYEEWRLSCLVMEEKQEDICKLYDENHALRDIHEQIVPHRVDNEGFWSLYFYKLQKLKQEEDARLKLAERAVDGNGGGLVKSSATEDGSVANMEKKEEDEKLAENKVAENKTHDGIGNELHEDPKPPCDGEVVLVEQQKDESVDDGEFVMVSIGSSLPDNEDFEWDDVEEDMVDCEDEEKEYLGELDLHDQFFTVNTDKMCLTEEC